VPFGRQIFKMIQLLLLGPGVPGPQEGEGFSGLGERWCATLEIGPPFGKSCFSEMT